MTREGQFSVPKRVVSKEGGVCWPDAQLSDPADLTTGMLQGQTRIAALRHWHLAKLLSFLSKQIMLLVKRWLQHVSTCSNRLEIRFGQSQDADGYCPLFCPPPRSIFVRKER